ncbi:hypothetical protein Mgra_00000549 [Meloidogyne graminicola]|uniref:Uncharacterized protein n=1 Tax=Meloidogyne graminicola TaxID=189291 RepID=A0A8T0A5A9_9BILA|nr:hypothetical protein Mgra_00000549 [Meloidogyne graminicola]
MFLFILHYYLTIGNCNKFIGSTRLMLWLMAASLFFMLIYSVKQSDAKPLIGNNFYQFNEQNLDKRESSKMLHRRELSGLKRLIDEIVRSGYDGGAAFRPGK